LHATFNLLLRGYDYGKPDITLKHLIFITILGGRESSGILKGFDPLLNLVLDNTIEYLRDPDDPYKLTEDTR
jgi:U6 snRNA-associated Sm-like protein LSm7